MPHRRKPLHEQVLVITGASSGIGLATARRAAERGARVVLAARNERALQQLAAELRSAGAEAVYATADVGKETDVKGIARTAVEHFGGFDTWVNNAGVGIFGSLLEGRLEDYRKLFETNFWGVVYGSLTAVRHLRERGGALVNVGSAVGDRALPNQGLYSASKHAVKGFTDALRAELRAEGVPVSVTLIKPASIDTPFPQHARNYMDEAPTLPAPVYAPDLVAEAILHAAERPVRDLVVGGGGKALSALGQRAPHLTDRVLGSRGFLEQQRSGKPPRNPEGALHAPMSSLQERGGYEGHVRETSLYTRGARHPFGLLAASALGVGVAVAALAGERTARARRTS
jgi:short-subunit dehydrogenase